MNLFELPAERKQARLATVEQKLVVCDFLTRSIRELMPGLQPVMPEGRLEYVRKPINLARPFKLRGIVKGWKALTSLNGSMYAAFIDHGDINLGEVIPTDELGGFVTLKCVEKPTLLNSNLVKDMSRGIGVVALEQSLHEQFEPRLQAASEKRQAARREQAALALQTFQPIAEHPFAIAA